MTDFMYLFRGGDPTWRSSSPEELQKHIQKWGAWIQELSESGNFKAGDPLAREGKQLSGKNKTLTDGPYAEAKDVVGGYLVVSAETLDEATELAKGCPLFENDGIVEVRPIQKM